MRDERDLAQATGKCVRGVRDVNQKRTTADSRAIEICRNDAQILGSFHRRHARGEDGIHIARGQACFTQCVVRRLGVQLNDRLVGQDANLVGLGRADDGNLVENMGVGHKGSILKVGLVMGN